MIGFKFDEVMTGYHFYSCGQKRFMEFRVTWGGMAKDLLGIFTGSATMNLKGVMTAEGLCSPCEPCFGTLELDYRRGSITYTIYFLGLGRERMKYVGRKTGIRPWNLHRTHTKCVGFITKSGSHIGEIVASSVTHFRLKTLPSFLKSFRMSVGMPAELLL